MSWWYHFVGWVLRLEDVDDIDSIHWSFAETWADPAWLILGGIILATLATVFYFKAQPKGRTPIGIALAIGRAGLLILLMLVLANPQAHIKYSHHPKPVLWLLFDGTDSMAMQDDFTSAERERLEKDTDLPRYRSDAAKSQQPVADKPTRQDYVKALLSRDKDNLLKRLAEKYTLQAYSFQHADGVDTLKLTPGEDGKSPDGAALAGQLKTDGLVSAIGDAIKDIAQRKASGDVAGLVMFSDFGNNAGVPPAEQAKGLGLPIYTVGIGPAAAVDVAVDLHTPLLMKKNERSTVGALIRATGLEGHKATVRITAQKVDGDRTGPLIPVGQRDITLGTSTVEEIFDFTPSDAGRFSFVAEVDKLSDEQADQNNRAEREVRVRDNHLRLMYVEYEPTWEWRFIKEVFHRDPLVGQSGFRTFLRSADPRVRQSNELFMPTLTPKRSDFFLTDVIFIGDVPPGTLTPRFCEMTKEFVANFGGGLVIISGPRFGPAALADTPIEDMLPVILDKEARLKDKQEFQLQLTPASRQFEFMRLGSSTNPAEAERENAKAWGNLGRLPWYQPVANKHPTLSTVLAEHPTDMCNDGKTHQPLIAVRQYGKGQVLYMGFDEMWRLRRKYRDLYYRQFWGQIIQLHALNHEIGEQKRFVVRTDAQQYKEDETVTGTIEAYDSNYLPLTDDKVNDRRLTGELILPVEKNAPAAKTSITATQVKEGVFETRFKVTAGGEYRLAMYDPIAHDTVEATFKVTSLSAERRSAVRDANTEEDLVRQSHGRSYDLHTVSALPDDLSLQTEVISSTDVKRAWNNWGLFGILVALMLGEWFTRKMINLP